MTIKQTPAQLLADQCDIEDSFEMSCRKELLRLDALNKELTQALLEIMKLCNSVRSK